MEKNEKDIQALTLHFFSIESKYDVSSWKLTNVQIWVLIKNIVYFQYRDNSGKLSLFQQLLYSGRIEASKLKRILKDFTMSGSKRSLPDLPAADALFAGANSHYTSWDGAKLNRYFDPIMDKGQFSSVNFNYSKDELPNLYRADRCFNIHAFAKGLTSRQLNVIKISNIQSDLKKLLQSNQDVKDVLTELLPYLNVTFSTFLKTLVHKVHTILRWKAIWGCVIEHVKPKIGVLLCYYNTSMYGLVLALREKNIPSVDMQHGGQGINHPAYSFNCSVKNGFNLLPDYFWVWDKTTATNIERWVSNTFHKVVIGGNPWLQMFSKCGENDEFMNDRKYILCCMTTDKPNLEVLPSAMLDVMRKASDEYVFGLRYHPRTRSQEKALLNEAIEKLDIGHKVDFHYANTMPLPLLLIRSWAHVAESSGSVAEAAMMGVKKNIIISSLGASNYAELIKDRKAVYFDLESSECLLERIVDLNLDNNIMDKTVFEEDLITIILQQPQFRLKT